jgi:hypothetical protein
VAGVVALAIGGISSFRYELVPLEVGSIPALSHPVVQGGIPDI